MQYYVYVKDLVGVRTNAKNFRWSFGSGASAVTEREYETCKVKIELTVVKDKQVPRSEQQGNFRFFYAPCNTGMLYYYRKVLGLFPLSFAVSIRENTIYATVGRTYYDRVRVKVMNIHPIWYILFDLTTVLLLQNGYLPMYAASFAYDDRGALLMGPPNMGKTITALRLAKNERIRLLGEDIAVTDGEKIYPVPLTNTYRRYSDADSDVRKIAFSGECAAISALYLLERGSSGVQHTDRSDEKVSLLHRYGIGWHSSPAVATLSYYNDAFSMKALLAKEEAILRQVLLRASVCTVKDEDASGYAALITDALQQEKNENIIALQH